MNNRGFERVGELIEQRHYADALKQANNFIQRTPNDARLLAMRAKALQELGNKEEALAQINQIIDMHNTDFWVSRMVQQVLFCLGKQDELLKDSEKLYKDNPTESNARELFIKYTYSDQLQKQQQLAIQMYKQWKKPIYQLWIITSLLQQAIVTPNSAQKSMFLKLAEGFVLQRMKEHKLNTVSELHLYFQILRMMDKYNEILKCLTDKHMSSLFQIPEDYLEIVVEVLLEISDQEKKKINLDLKESELKQGQEQVEQQQSKEWIVLKGYINRISKCLLIQFNGDNWKWIQWYIKSFIDLRDHNFTLEFEQQIENEAKEYYQKQQEDKSQDKEKEKQQPINIQPSETIKTVSFILQLPSSPIKLPLIGQKNQQSSENLPESIVNHFEGLKHFIPVNRIIKCEQEQELAKEKEQEQQKDKDTELGQQQTEDPFQPDHTNEQMRKFIKEELFQLNPLLRGSRFAEIELEIILNKEQQQIESEKTEQKDQQTELKICDKSKSDENELSNVGQLIQQFIRDFSPKPSCSNDIQKYFNQLNIKEQKSIIDSLIYDILQNVQYEKVQNEEDSQIKVSQKIKNSEEKEKELKNEEQFYIRQCYSLGTAISLNVLYQQNSRHIARSQQLNDQKQSINVQSQSSSSSSSSNHVQFLLHKSENARSIFSRINKQRNDDKQIQQQQLPDGVPNGVRLKTELYYPPENLMAAYILTSAAARQLWEESYEIKERLMDIECDIMREDEEDDEQRLIKDKEKDKEKYQDIKQKQIANEQSWVQSIHNQISKQIQAASILDHALSNGDVIHFLPKQQLVSLHLSLCSTETAFFRYKELGLKHVQQESLFFFIFPSLLLNWDTKNIKLICNRVESFHEEFLREGHEYIQKCYISQLPDNDKIEQENNNTNNNNGSHLGLITEFYKFEKKMKDSLELATAHATTRMMTSLDMICAALHQTALNIDPSVGSNKKGSSQQSSQQQSGLFGFIEGWDVAHSLDSKISTDLIMKEEQQQSKETQFHSQMYEIKPFNSLSSFSEPTDIINDIDNRLSSNTDVSIYDSPLSIKYDLKKISGQSRNARKKKKSSGDASDDAVIGEIRALIRDLCRDTSDQFIQFAQVLSTTRIALTPPESRSESSAEASQIASSGSTALRETLQKLSNFIRQRSAEAAVLKWK
ncbi:MAG: hypothetical protein EZS28_000400 [Streblomastix strix]|uniref:Uncharacterized protein n=1 Tax=Streblomastix strix TaxID=222440 RepID=A0A5J4XC20_9EUKA|nr:MAG: hypothetical protein EZS28_000400 [Streblomastix strix]